MTDRSVTIERMRTRRELLARLRNDDGSRVLDPLAQLRSERSAEELRDALEADRSVLRDLEDAAAPAVELPHLDLFRMHEDVRYRADGDDDDQGDHFGLGTMVGYATVFDDWTEINSWEGKFRERIMHGATKKTIRMSGDGRFTKALYQHGWDPYVGQKPLGPPRVMREDERGLWTETPLVDTSYNRDIAALLEAGALDGMSIRMDIVRDEWWKDCDSASCTARFDLRKARSGWLGWYCPECEQLNDSWDPVNWPERTIKELRMPEYSVVTFPAYRATTVGVRSAAAFHAWIEAGMPEQPERSAGDQLADYVRDRVHAETAARGDTTTDDAPADPGHPSDAPADSGHPSTSERSLSQQQRRRDVAQLKERRTIRQQHADRYTEADDGQQLEDGYEPPAGHRG